MAKAGIQFSKKDEWYTPKEVVDFFGPFDYDPATTREQAKHLGIEVFDDISSDGLKSDWGHHRRIWVNPPFTKKFDFLNKALETIMWHYETKVFFLMPAETITTKRFHEIMGGQPYTLWIPDGRIKFEDGSGKSSSPAFGSVVIELDGNFVGTQIKHWRLNGQDSRV